MMKEEVIMNYRVKKEKIKKKMLFRRTMKKDEKVLRTASEGEATTLYR